MTKLNLCAVTVKKYKPHSTKKVAEDLENVLKRDFTTTYINEKWVGDITYIHTSRDGWCYLASVLDLHSKKIIGYAFGKRIQIRRQPGLALSFIIPNDWYDGEDL